MNGRIKKQNQQRTGLNVCGNIRIGEKNEKGYPTSLDYFKVDAQGEYQKMVRDKYGDKPTMLKIIFASDDFTDSCCQYLELRDSSGKRVAHGDGLHFFEAKQIEGRVVDVPILPHDPIAYIADLEKKTGSKFKEQLKMRFMILDVPLFGVFELRTGGSESSIKNIISAIDAVFDTCGRIKGIPFDLHIEKVKSDKAGSKSQYPVLSITANLSPENAEKVRALPSSGIGVIRESNLGLASGAIQSAQSEPEEASYTFVEEPKRFDAAEYLDNFQLKNAADANDILVALSRQGLERDKSLAAFKLLCANAEKIFIYYNKEKKIFE